VAWNFTNSTNNVQVADNAALTLPDGDWTLAIKLDRTAAPAYDARIFETLEGPTQYGFYTNGGNAVEFYSLDDDGTEVDVLSSTSVLDDNPHTLIAVRSGSRIDLYLDTTSVANVTNANFDAVNGGTLYIGNRGGGTQNRGFPGSLAEFAKWDRALSTAEIAALVKGFAPTHFPSSLKVYIPMIRDYVEVVNRLPVTNTSSTVGAHPRIFYPNKQPRVYAVPSLGAQTLSIPATQLLTAYAPTLFKIDYLAVPATELLAPYAPTLYKIDYVGMPAVIELMGAYAPALVPQDYLVVPGTQLLTAYSPSIFATQSLILPVTELLSIYSPALVYDQSVSMPSAIELLGIFSPSISTGDLLSPPVIQLLTAYTPSLFYNVTLGFPAIQLLTVYTPSIYRGFTSRTFNTDTFTDRTLNTGTFTERNLSDTDVFIRRDRNN